MGYNKCYLNGWKLLVLLLGTTFICGLIHIWSSRECFEQQDGVCGIELFLVVSGQQWSSGTRSVELTTRKIRSSPDLFFEFSQILFFKGAD